MKWNRLTLICATILAVASTGVMGGIAQPLTGTKPAYCLESTSAAKFGPGDFDWQQEFANIDLSTEQVNRICQLKATLHQEAFGSGFKLDSLLEWAQAGSQGEQEFRRSPIAQAIRNYNAGIQWLLTPEQYQQWQQNGGGER